jgi:hypothetical protein
LLGAQVDRNMRHREAERCQRAPNELVPSITGLVPAAAMGAC